FLKTISAPSSTIEIKRSPTPIWTGNAICNYKLGRVDGHLSEFRLNASRIRDAPLIVANLDPQYLASELLVGEGIFAIDCYEAWIRYRIRELTDYLLLAKVISITDVEFELLPQSVRDILDRTGKILLIKRGPRGVLVKQGNFAIQLPPPTTSSV